MEEVSNIINQWMPVYCICQSSAINEFMILCDFCEEWFHGHCVGITPEESEEIDKFCCDQCKKQNSFLETTYLVKKKQNKINRKKCTAKNEKKCQTTVEYVDSSRTPNTSSFDSAGMTIREAHHAPSKKIATGQNDKRKKSKKKEPELKQCYGPGCTNASRKDSKYCSDACGEALAKNRILEVLQLKISQWTSTPSAADEMSHKKLASIRAQMHEAQMRFQALDIEIIRLINKISQSKQPGNNFVEEHCDDTTPADCMLCGAEIPHKSFIKHLEQCYLRSDRKIRITEHTKHPVDSEWAIFCNQRISTNVYCKKMKVLCPFHYKGFRRNDEVCGYNLGEKDGVVQYCGNVGRTCDHINWEQILRAELDLRKMNLLFKINGLKVEVDKIREEMSRRGNFMALMLNSTTVEGTVQKKI